jgi:hypothetical protein
MIPAEVSPPDELCVLSTDTLIVALLELINDVPHHRTK